ncbi:hypothetical protein Dda_7409 [Drechslerella dactyloides]|uniref:Aminoglycoside phosphotransferase domain-containing protein n=1 Tax=Drechslerella dactyloides TaxID=74499 RepID=A0AAD6IWF1_DREDA|nr:hypothetical protein Dda_7409 [Drechslerella dactyloides]
MALHEMLSDSELARLCYHPDRILLCGHVVKISDEAVIKFGPLRPEEAENLRLARAILDPDKVYVPRLYRFFEYQKTHYLVMEYIRGDPAPGSEYEHLAERVGDILKHFHNISSMVPGSLGGGISCGAWWRSDYPDFRTTEQLEDWVNRRLGTGLGVSFGKCDLVLCHLDLAPRNIIEMPNGSLCILDWESAGYYPRFFEAAALLMTNMHTTKFEKILLDRLQCDLEPDESRMADVVAEAWNRSDYKYL